jgi:hypothetical protein
VTVDETDFYQELSEELIRVRSNGPTAYGHLYGNSTAIQAVAVGLHKGCFANMLLYRYLGLFGSKTMRSGCIVHCQKESRTYSLMGRGMQSVLLRRSTLSIGSEQTRWPWSTFRCGTSGHFCMFAVPDTTMLPQEELLRNG